MSSYHMSKTILLRCAGIIFGIVALAHLVRLILGWEVSIAGRALPLWGSGLAVIVTGFLAYQSLRNKPTHYICTGGCGGVSATSGVCQAATCSKKGMPLVEE